jgi:type I restriction enzyme S subunit
MVFGKSPSRARRIVRDGDILVATVRTYLRAITHVPHAGANLICSTGFTVLTAGPRVLPRYLFYWTRSEPFVAAVVSRSVGISYPAINPPELAGLPVPLQSLQRQSAVAALLDGETAKIDDLIAKKQRLIEVLEESRTAQINRVVTQGLDTGAPTKQNGTELARAGARPLGEA